MFRSFLLHERILSTANTGRKIFVSLADQSKNGEQCFYEGKEIGEGETDPRSHSFFREAACELNVTKGHCSDKDAALRNRMRFRGSRMCPNEDFCPTKATARKMDTFHAARREDKVAFFSYRSRDAP